MLTSIWWITRALFYYFSTMLLAVTCTLCKKGALAGDKKSSTTVAPQSARRATHMPRSGNCPASDDGFGETTPRTEQQSSSVASTPGESGKQFKFNVALQNQEEDNIKTDLRSLDEDNPLLNPAVRARLMARNKKLMSAESAYVNPKAKENGKDKYPRTIGQDDRNSVFYAKSQNQTKEANTVATVPSTCNKEEDNVKETQEDESDKSSGKEIDVMETQQSEKSAKEIKVSRKATRMSEQSPVAEKVSRKPSRAEEGESALGKIVRSEKKVPVSVKREPSKNLEHPTQRTEVSKFQPPPPPPSHPPLQRPRPQPPNKRRLGRNHTVSAETVSKYLG